MLFIGFENIVAKKICVNLFDWASNLFECNQEKKEIQVFKTSFVSVVKMMFSFILPQSPCDKFSWIDFWDNKT